MFAEQKTKMNLKNKEGSKQVRKEANKEVRKQASKEGSKQGSKETSKQGRKQGSDITFCSTACKSLQKFVKCYNDL